MIILIIVSIERYITTTIIQGIVGQNWNTLTFLFESGGSWAFCFNYKPCCFCYLYVISIVEFKILWILEVPKVQIKLTTAKNNNKLFIGIFFF